MKETVAQGGPLKHEQLLIMLQTPPQQQHVPLISRFAKTHKFKEYVKQAINATADNKSTGIDGVFVESLHPTANQVSDLTCTPWDKCGQLRYMSLLWRTVRISPLYKKSDPSDPNNYRPISIISQMRKGIDKAIDYAVREK